MLRQYRWTATDQGQGQGQGQVTLLLWHYSDTDCSVPLYCVIVRGSHSQRGPAWQLPGATQVQQNISFWQCVL